MIACRVSCAQPKLLYVDGFESGLPNQHNISLWECHATYSVIGWTDTTKRQASVRVFVLHLLTIWPETLMSHGKQACRDVTRLEGLVRTTRYHTEILLSRPLAQLQVSYCLARSKW